MKLTNATEQALAIMALLSTQEKDVPVSSIAIYQKLSVSSSYIRKLLRKLVVSNIIEGVSGNNGGFYIKKELSDITLLHIVEAIEEPFHSFPKVGVLERAFSDFTKIAQTGDEQIAECFSRADKKWNKELERITVEDILSDVFREYGEIPHRNWNDFIEDERSIQC
ncbi:MULTISPECIES: Rrf2 family transcriptional regulator [Enterococcaceae]|uniref:RrF2 family transcriptional regulator n=1 Tax=Enterococcaceae TaxID=81852 RepID=UPI000E53E3F4|nr:MULTISPECIES: Rrf2 family transcriptional regulator [Enterococcaceae]MCI0130408.1 Rrf2 family transcriptional regulator [Vagococcus sp. CY53-2]RGI32138.1 Rrf2 family transcriptional regulator [Melissococcus sp. OM08-11BH]UNM89843.1 Rrf2 family transcriptional regulator [Vagococcus sp. CY52-2]